MPHGDVVRTKYQFLRGHLQTRFALMVGTFLLLLSLISFVSRGTSIFGVSTTMDHSFLRFLTGVAYVWNGTWASHSCARGWNKFLGWLYLIFAVLGIMDIEWMSKGVGANKFGDDILNTLIAVSSLGVGYYKDEK